MKFIASPEPLPDESRASWIQRVCGAHGYSMKKFCEYVGVDPNRVDWDFGVDAKRWSALAEDSGHSMQCFQRNDRDWALIKQLHRHPVSSLVVDRKPASQWCAACLIADSTPHLRWYWRIAELRRCPYHDAKLSMRCPWCHGCMNLSTAHMVPSGKKRGTANLAGCASCGMPFVVEEDCEPRASWEWECARPWLPGPINALREVLNRRALSEWSTRGEEYLALQKHPVEKALLPPQVFDQLRSNPAFKAGVIKMTQTAPSQKVPPPRAYRLLKLNDHWTASSKSEMGAYILERERKRVLGTDFKLIQAHRSPHSCKPVRKTTFWTPTELTKWSALLAPPARVRVAKALLIIRQEKARQRARALEGVDEDEEQTLINSHVPFYKGR